MSFARHLLESAVPDRASLEKEYLSRNDDYWGIESRDEETGEVVDPYTHGGALQSKFKDNSYSGTQCTGYACALRKKLGPERVQVFGFHSEDNEDSSIGQEAGGHDFAVVDGRWIVDPWVTEFYSDQQGGGSRGVFDMQDPEDAAEVRRLYGKRSTWQKAVNADNDVTYDGATRGHFDENLYRLPRPGIRKKKYLANRGLAAARVPTNVNFYRRMGTLTDRP